MFDSVYSKWRENKPLAIGALLFLVVFGFILMRTAFFFVNLQQVKGEILSVKLDRQKGTYLTIKLVGDNKIYYQEYKKRFFDQEALKLHQKDSLCFFTFKSPEKKRGAISSLGDRSSFLYWPIFSINRKAGIVQVFYFYVYNNVITELLLAISVVLVLYNGFNIFLRASWLIKLPLILLTFLMAWLWF